MIKVEDIICRQIGDEVVLIKDDGLSLHVLNKTAAMIWEMCDGGHKTEEIVARLCEKYDVTADEASADVTAILNELQQKGLLKQIEES